MVGVELSAKKSYSVHLLQMDRIRSRDLEFVAVPQMDVALDQLRLAVQCRLSRDAAEVLQGGL